MSVETAGSHDARLRQFVSQSFMNYFVRIFLYEIMRILRINIILYRMINML